MTKNIFGKGRVETTLMPEKSNSFKRSNTDVSQKHGYFKQQSCDLGTEDDNFPENSVFYVNQGYQSYKYNKKVYCVDYYIIG